MLKEYSEELTDEEREVIEYGLAQGKVMLAGWAVALLTGALFQVFWESLVFLIGFTALRTYAGGYHADTQARCGIFSFLMMCASCFFIRFANLQGGLAVGAGMLLCVMIGLMAPVENVQRILDSGEKKLYGNKARLIALGEFLILCVTAWLGWKQITRAVLAVFLLVLMLMMLGKIKYRQSAGW